MNFLKHKKSSKITFLPVLILAVLTMSCSLIPSIKTYAAGQPPEQQNTQNTVPDESKRPDETLSGKSCNKKTRIDQTKSNLDPANCGITGYVLILINVLSATLGVAVTAVIIVAGIQYSASAGNPQATAAAKKRITNAVLALVFFAGMYGFLQWIVPGGVF